MTEKTILDLKGLVSPLDLFKCTRRLSKMAPGEVLEVILADTDVARGLTTIINRSGNRLIYTEQRADGICLGIQKGEATAGNVSNGQEGECK